MKRKIKQVCNRPIRKYLGDVGQKKRAEKNPFFLRDTRLGFSDVYPRATYFLDRPHLRTFPFMCSLHIRTIPSLYFLFEVSNSSYGIRHRFFLRFGINVMKVEKRIKKKKKENHIFFFRNQRFHIINNT
jgi:hypothetical protein